MSRKPNMIEVIAGDLLSEGITSDYAADYAASSALDTMRRYRWRALVALFAPKRTRERWEDDAFLSCEVTS